jgi:hypothetical protein
LQEKIKMTERIAEYFKGTLSAQDKARFEADLKSDRELADAVAAYLAASKAANEPSPVKTYAESQSKSNPLQKPQNRFVSLRAWYSVAAALALAAFGLGWYALKPGERDLAGLANGYIFENFTTLSAQPGNGDDSIQLAINNYNRGQYATALRICKDVIQNDAENAEANKIAGIISLKLLDYDTAIQYFHNLASLQEIRANPGKFYEAIALIRSGVPANKERAEVLLNEVLDQGLGGKNEVIKWND